MLRFSDGMVIRTDGELRAVRKSDGWYVVGHGMCVPVADREDALETIRAMRRAA